MRDLQSLRLMPAPYQSVALTQPARPFEFGSEATTVAHACLGLLGCTSTAHSVAPFDVSDLAPPDISVGSTTASEAPEAAAPTSGGQDPCPLEARPAKRRRVQQAPPPDPASATTQQAQPPDPSPATTQQAQPPDSASATSQQAAAPSQPAAAPDDHGAAAGACQLQLVAAAAAAAAQPLVLALPYGDAASRQRWYEQYQTAAAQLGAIQAAEAKAGQPLCNDRASVLEYSAAAAASSEVTASADQRWQQDPSSRRRRQGASAAAGRGDPGPGTSREGSGAQRADAAGAVAAGNGTAGAAVAEGAAGRRQRGGRRAAVAAAAAGQGLGGDLSEEEVVVHVVMHHGHARSRPLMEVLVLGSQTVAQLRDVLACPTDTFLAGFQQGRGGAAILLEDALLVDRRDPGNHDYSQEILRFCREHDTARPRPRKSGGTVMEAVVKPGQGQEPRVLQMEATQWGDLALRCGDGMGYLYLHQGCCEHRLEIRDVRQLHPLDRQNRSDYPLVVHTEPLSRRQCSICQRAPAAQVTLEDPLAPCHPCWMCDGCYTSLHFDAAGGRLAPNVRVVPYVGE